MAQGDPPAKQWADSDGNVVAEIRYDVANDELIIDQVNGTDIDFQQSDLSNIASVSTGVSHTGGDPVHHVEYYDGDIQAAIDAAGTWETVFIPPGTYDLSDSDLTVTDHIRIVGSGEGAELLNGGIDVDQASIIVTDLSIAGAGNGIEVSDGTDENLFKVERVSFSNIGVNPIQINNAQTINYDRTIVRDVSINGAGDEGLRLGVSGGSLCLVEGCDIRNVETRGIRAGETPGPTVVTVSGCVVDTVDAPDSTGQTIGIMTRGASLQSVRDCDVIDIATNEPQQSDGVSCGSDALVSEVDNCFVKNAGGRNAAIRMKEAGEGRTTIRDCVLVVGYTSEASAGIRVQSADELLIEGCTISDYGAEAVIFPSGASIDDATIRDNNIDHTHGSNRAIYLRDGGETNLHIEGNHQLDGEMVNFVQVDLRGSTDYNLDYVKLIGNTITTENNPGRGPLWVQAESGGNDTISTVMVKDNDCRFADAWIRTQDVGTDALSRVSITGNTEQGRGNTSADITDEAELSLIEDNLTDTS